MLCYRTNKDNVTNDTIRWVWERTPWPQCTEFPCRWNNEMTTAPCHIHTDKTPKVYCDIRPAQTRPQEDTPFCLWTLTALKNGQHKEMSGKYSGSPVIKHIQCKPTTEVYSEFSSPIKKTNSSFAHNLKLVTWAWAHVDRSPLFIEISEKYVWGRN